MFLRVGLNDLNINAQLETDGFGLFKVHFLFDHENNYVRLEGNNIYVISQEGENVMAHFELTGFTGQSFERNSKGNFAALFLTPEIVFQKF